MAALSKQELKSSTPRQHQARNMLGKRTCFLAQPGLVQMGKANTKNCSLPGSETSEAEQSRREKGERKRLVRGAQMAHKVGSSRPLGKEEMHTES